MMMLDALTERRPLLEVKLLMEVVGSHPQSRGWRKMLMPALTGQDEVDSERNWETVSLCMAFF